MPVINTRELPGFLVSKPYEREIKAVLAPELSNYDKATAILVSMPPGGSTGLHKHDSSDEIIYVVSGEGELVEVIEGREATTIIKPYHVIVIRAGTPHMVSNKGPSKLEAFCIFIPPLSPPTGIIAEAINKVKEYLKSK